MNSTYSPLVAKGVILDPSVEIVVDSDEASSTATTELGLDAEHGDSVLSSLELFADRSLNVRTLHGGDLGVQDVNSLDERISEVREDAGQQNDHLPSAFYREGGSR